MMNEKTYYPEYWKCSCNSQNRLFMRKCPICNAEMSNEVQSAIYKNEINRQNKVFEKEEKNRKIILSIVAIAVLPVLLTNLVSVLAFMLLLLGLLAGTLYVKLTCDYMLKKADYSNVSSMTFIAYITMMIAFVLAVLLSDRWDEFIKLLMMLPSGVNIILMIKSKKIFRPVIIQTAIMLLVILI